MRSPSENWGAEPLALASSNPHREKRRRTCRTDGFLFIMVLNATLIGLYAIPARCVRWMTESSFSPREKSATHNLGKRVDDGAVFTRPVRQFNIAQDLHAPQRAADDVRGRDPFHARGCD